MLAFLVLVQAIVVRASIVFLFDDQRFWVLSPSVSRMMTLSRSGPGDGALNGATGDSVFVLLDSIGFSSVTVTLVDPAGTTLSSVTLTGTTDRDDLGERLDSVLDAIYAVFAEGWSTKEPPAHRERGIGLPLVRRLAERQGGVHQALVGRHALDLRGPGSGVHRQDLVEPGHVQPARLVGAEPEQVRRRLGQAHRRTGRDRRVLAAQRGHRPLVVRLPCVIAHRTDVRPPELDQHPQIWPDRKLPASSTLGGYDPRHS